MQSLGKKGGTEARREWPKPEAKRAHELSVVANVYRAETQPTDRDRANGTCEVKRGAAKVQSAPSKCLPSLRKATLPRRAAREGKPGSIGTQKIMKLKETPMNRRPLRSRQFSTFQARRIIHRTKDNGDTIMICRQTDGLPTLSSPTLSSSTTCIHNISHVPPDCRRWLWLIGPPIIRVGE